MLVHACNLEYWLSLIHLPAPANFWNLNWFLQLKKCSVLTLSWPGPFERDFDKQLNSKNGNIVKFELCSCTKHTIKTALTVGLCSLIVVRFFFQAQALSDSLNLRTVCTYMRACHPSSTNPGGRSTYHGPIFSSLVGPKASKWGTTCLASEDDSLAHDQTTLCSTRKKKCRHSCSLCLECDVSQIQEK